MVGIRSWDWWNVGGNHFVHSTEYIVLSTQPSPNSSPAVLGLGARRDNPLRHAQLRAAAAGIALCFCLTRPNRLLRQPFQPRIASKRLFHAAVFERMKAD